MVYWDGALVDVVLWWYSMCLVNVVSQFLDDSGYGDNDNENVFFSFQLSQNITIYFNSLGLCHIQGIIS